MPLASTAPDIRSFDIQFDKLGPGFTGHNIKAIFNDLVTRKTKLSKVNSKLPPSLKHGCSARPQCPFLAISIGMDISLSSSRTAQAKPSTMLIYRL